MAGSDMMTSTDASRVLGVSVRQVQRLVDAGWLTSAGRVGRSILIDAASVHEVANRGAQPGRPWNQATAWAALELLSSDKTDRLTETQRSRLRSRLRGLTAAELIPLARRRARTCRYRVSASFLDRLRERVVSTGSAAISESADVAARFGLAAGRTETVDGYLAARDLDNVVGEYLMVPDHAGNATLRVVEVDGFNRATPVVVALDLAESLDPRERSAGRRVLKEMLHRYG
jgi:excisionase family DNA binding protein